MSIDDLDQFTIKTMHKADAIIFDCDGVLIDIAESYDVTIKQTVAHTLASLHEESPVIDGDIIDAFKASGGFNDEVDLTYAAIICTIAANATKQDPRKFIIKACKSIDSLGIIAIEQYVLGQADISETIKKLGYPGERNTSQIHDTFNQIFYGPTLYSKLFGKDSAFRVPGKIDSDVLLVDSQTMRTLTLVFGKKPAIVTGRSRASFDYSVSEPLRSEFDIANSVFLEDEPRSMAKPNPDSLVSTIRRMGSKTTVYVGDSMEDLIMAQRATELGHKTLFCGITQTSSDVKAKKTLFERAGAHATISTVSKLAKILNRQDR